MRLAGMTMSHGPWVCVVVLEVSRRLDLGVVVMARMVERVKLAG